MSANHAIDSDTWQALLALARGVIADVEAVEKVPTRSHAGKIYLGSVRLMNLDIEAEQGHDRGTEALFVTETRTSCRDSEDRIVIRISRDSHWGRCLT
jgi:hypothetical protein